MSDRKLEGARGLSMLANLLGPITRADRMDIVDYIYQSEFGEHLHVLVLSLFIVDHAASEAFTGAVFGAFLKAVAVMGEPLGCHSAYVFFCFPEFEVLDQCSGFFLWFRVAHLEEFVCVEVAHPCVLVTMWFRTSFHEHVCLNVFGSVSAWNVVEGDSGGGDVVEIFALGERRFATVVDDIEAPDPMMVIVVREPF